MSKSLYMKFINKEGKASSLKINEVKDDVTKEEVNAAMDTIIGKNIFKSTGGDLVAKDSAYFVDREKTEIKLK